MNRGRGGNNAGGGRGGRGNKKMNYRQKSSIRFSDDSGDPPFIRAMKEKLGYRETQIEDKYEEHVSDDEGTSRDPDDIRNMKEGERPAVVVLDPKSDITVEELDVEVLKKRDEDERRMIEEGKITFKKPEKRPLAKSTKPEANTNANSQSEENKSNEQSDEGNKPAKIPPPPPPQQSNARLLSFGDDEDNE